MFPIIICLNPNLLPTTPFALSNTRNSADQVEAKPMDKGWRRVFFFLSPSWFQTSENQD